MHFSFKENKGVVHDALDVSKTSRVDINYHLFRAAKAPGTISTFTISYRALRDLRRATDLWLASSKMNMLLCFGEVAQQGKILIAAC
jgi:hypothetical protein